MFYFTAINTNMDDQKPQDDQQQDDQQQNTQNAQATPDTDTVTQDNSFYSDDVRAEALADDKVDADLLKEDKEEPVTSGEMEIGILIPMPKKAGVARKAMMKKLSQVALMLPIQTQINL